MSRRIYRLVQVHRSRCVEYISCYVTAQIAVDVRHVHIWKRSGAADLDQMVTVRPALPCSLHDHHQTCHQP